MCAQSVRFLSTFPPSFWIFSDVVNQWTTSWLSYYALRRLHLFPVTKYGTRRIQSVCKRICNYCMVNTFSQLTMTLILYILGQCIMAAVFCLIESRSGSVTADSIGPAFVAWPSVVPDLRVSLKLWVGLSMYSAMISHRCAAFEVGCIWLLCMLYSLIFQST